MQYCPASFIARLRGFAPNPLAREYVGPTGGWTCHWECPSSGNGLERLADPPHQVPSLLLSLLGWGQAFPTAGAAVLQAHKQEGGSVFTGVFLALP